MPQNPSYQGINTALRRCVELGAALGDAIRASAWGGNVLILASGGLSHWLPSNDPRDPSVTGERRDALIHGRRDTRAFAAAREPKVRAMGGNPGARVNADWDTWFLQQLGTANLDSVIDLGSDGLEELAGSGGHEIRSWLIGHAAARFPLVWTSYEPVPQWITGMAIGTTVAVTDVTEVADVADVTDVTDVTSVTRFRFGNSEPIFGRAAIARSTEGTVDAIWPVRHRVDQVAQLGSQLFCRFTIQGTVPDGTELAMPCVTVIELRDGLITDYAVHMDISPALRSPRQSNQ